MQKRKGFRKVADEKVSNFFLNRAFVLHNLLDFLLDMV